MGSRSRSGVIAVRFNPLWQAIKFPLELDTFKGSFIRAASGELGEMDPARCRSRLRGVGFPDESQTENVYCITQKQQYCKGGCISKPTDALLVPCQSSGVGIQLAHGRGPRKGHSIR